MRRIWETIRDIPRGSVASYGQIADIAGIPRGARQVGYALRHVPEGMELPWHRVLQVSGKSAFSANSRAFARQRDRLAEEKGGDARDADLEKRMGEALGRRARLQRKVRGALNPHWESVFREGRAASRFGRQVMEFSCIYTARVSNLLRYPADKFFARPLEILPHDRWILSER